MDKSDIIYYDLSYQITGVCFSVHNELGRFYREKQYSDLLEKRFNDENIPIKREYALSDSGNRVDFLIDEKIILEVKVKQLLEKRDYYQVQRYLS